MDEVPAGWVMVSCERAQEHFWDYLYDMLSFNDVCQVVGGAAIGPRADGLPDLVVRCPHNSAAANNFNCVIATDVYWV